MLSLSSLWRSLGTNVCNASSTSHRIVTALSPLSIFTRGRGQLAPRQVKHVKRHKGRVPIPTGGSIKGTTLAYGEWGIRIKGDGARLSAKQLTTAEEVIKKKIKVIKGTKVYLRVFPDIPVCIKGNETRMGKGKGTFEYWATRVPTGRVIFEIGGAPIREELAREALRQAASKLPTKMEFINRSTPPRLGNLVLHPPKPPPGHANLPSRLNNLGSSSQFRFKRTGDLADTESAMSNQQRAVELAPLGPKVDSATIAVDPAVVQGEVQRPAS